MKRKVEDGRARVHMGQLPDKVEGTPRTNFIIADQRDIKNTTRERILLLEERLRLVLNELEEMKRTKKGATD